MRAGYVDSALHRISELELPLCHACHRWGSRRQVCRFFSAISKLGDGHYWYMTLALMLLFQGPAALGLCAQVMIAGTVCHATYKLLKRRTARLRPCEEVLSLQALGSEALGSEALGSEALGGQALHPAVAPLDKYSFPSGHTMHAVFFTALIGAHLPALLWIFVPFSILTAVSRVVLGLHYPTDVVAGAFLGALLANLSLLVF